MPPIRIRIGSDPDHLYPITPNQDDTPILINNNHFTGYVVVRIRNYQSLPTDSMNFNTLTSQQGSEIDINPTSSTISILSSSKPSSINLSRSDLGSQNDIVKKGEEYFEGKRRYFSIQFCGRFRKNWYGSEIEFGKV